MSRSACKMLEDRDQLLRYLARSRPRHQPLVLDNYALQGQDLGLILQQTGRAASSCSTSARQLAGRHQPAG
ncbi:hypothetical protein UMZ34_07030 [Halopseudomonas pachastrellae]|nr:hypothetical protein UMZ34_07030 [Halopseudomonas pachastrellae]